MKQYAGFKQKYPEALLLFRVGDFYETFGEDAIETSRILGIVLTKRANGAAATIELAGFPHHSLDNYLPKLVRAGKKVAVVDQLEDPKLAKGIVKRGVTELVSPGVAYSDRILEQKESNYIASIAGEEPNLGVSLLDISTGKWMVASGNAAHIDRILQSFQPSEVVIPKKWRPRFAHLFGEDFFITGIDDWMFDAEFANRKIKEYFSVASLRGFGIETQYEAITAAGVLLHFLHENQVNQTGHLQHIQRIDPDGFMWLDRFTIRNLELLFSPHDKGVPLIQIIDLTSTPMGARLLRQWLTMPLCHLEGIQYRLNLTAYLVKHATDRSVLMNHLMGVYDLERLVSRAFLKKTNPRELYMLSDSLKTAHEIKLFLSGKKEWKDFQSQWDGCLDLVDLIGQSIDPDAGVSLQKGNVFRSGVSAELDELKTISRDGKSYLLELQKRELQKTGISSLKVGFNNVFGYYLEVTHVHKDKVPADWIRKQTLTNAERYITPELKEYEEKITGAEEKIIALEQSLYAQLLDNIQAYLGKALETARNLAFLDVIVSFSEISTRWNYCHPEMKESGDLMLKGSRHPVIEQKLPLDAPYIPNDIWMDQNEQRLIILTGPNMSGKSAILRQTALAVILSHIGCFVPCSEASIPLTDKLFTRVGASDNISSGESTFMVEMTETASILNNLSPRSFVFLDEIGRGTSTFDGISLAWSIAEYLLQHPTQPKTLFATHYHELNQLEKEHQGAKNYYIQILEQGNKIIFLRKLAAGGSEHSFGIHVARMAAIPDSVLLRATHILQNLESTRETSAEKTVSSPKLNTPQLSFFSLDDPLLSRINEELRKVDVNRLTPLEALMKLHQIKQLLEKTDA